MMTSNCSVIHLPPAVKNESGVGVGIGGWRWREMSKACLEYASVKEPANIHRFIGNGLYVWSRCRGQYIIDSPLHHRPMFVFIITSNLQAEELIS